MHKHRSKHSLLLPNRFRRVIYKQSGALAFIIWFAQKCRELDYSVKINRLAYCIRMPRQPIPGNHYGHFKPDYYPAANSLQLA